MLRSMTVLPLDPRSRVRFQDPLDVLSPREREILALFAAGYSNAAICAEQHLSEKTVETHARSIYRKLDLPTCRYSHRRVLAVLMHLQSAARRLAA